MPYPTRDGWYGAVPETGPLRPDHIVQRLSDTLADSAGRVILRNAGRGDRPA